MPVLYYILPNPVKGETQKTFCASHKKQKLPPPKKRPPTAYTSKRTVASHRCQRPAKPRPDVRAANANRNAQRPVAKPPMAPTPRPARRCGQFPGAKGTAAAQPRPEERSVPRRQRHRRRPAPPGGAAASMVAPTPATATQPRPAEPNSTPQKQKRAPPKKRPPCTLHFTSLPIEIHQHFMY